MHYWNFECWMPLGTKNSFSNTPWDFHMLVLNFRSMFLLSNTFQNILDGFASFHSQKDSNHLTDFGPVWELRVLWKLRNFKDYFLGVYPNVCFHICLILKSETWRQKSLKQLKALNTNSGISLSSKFFILHHNYLNEKTWSLKNCRTL